MNIEFENKLNVIDMHCDTITRQEVVEQGLRKADLHINLEKMMEGEYLMQCFATFIFLMDKRDTPFNLANGYMDILDSELEKNKDIISQITTLTQLADNVEKKKMSALYTIEEGGVLEGKMENLHHFYNRGVRMMTLTWNFPNEIGFPNFKLERGKEPDMTIPNDKDGLTPFGIEVVKEMNRLGMIVDVSHLSDAGFLDVVKYSDKPFVASHSNSRSVCNCVRNLTDDMIKALDEKGGVMGINFCADFISNSTENQIPDIIRHIKHIKEVGSINCIALGSDFDGIDTPKGMSDCTKMHLLKKALEEDGFTDEEIHKIFYKNFLRVFKEVCNY